MNTPLPTEAQLCKHDWVGDDDCQYCRVDELQAAITEACSDMGCFCPETEAGHKPCPMCKLQGVLRGH